MHNFNVNCKTMLFFIASNLLCEQCFSLIGNCIAILFSNHKNLKHYQTHRQNNTSQTINKCLKHNSSFGLLSVVLLNNLTAKRQFSLLLHKIQLRPMKNKPHTYESTTRSTLYSSTGSYSTSQSGGVLKSLIWKQTE